MQMTLFQMAPAGFRKPGALRQSSYVMGVATYFAATTVAAFVWAFHVVGLL